MSGWKRTRLLGDTQRSREYKTLVDRLGISEFVHQSITHAGEVVNLRDAFGGRKEHDAGNTTLSPDTLVHRG